MNSPTDAARCEHGLPPKQCVTCTSRNAPVFLWEFTDAEIAAEYHRRAHKALGDQRIGVTVPVLPSIG